jgi:glyoxylase-like metal-dependent hydrolase (beta-lactamase superfamily II)
LDWSDRALDRRVEEGSEIVFCRDNIKKELPDRRGLVIRPPEISFDSPIELDLGGVTCQIVPVGGDHDSGSTVVYAAEDKVLFLGDCLSEDYYSGPASYTTRSLFPLIERVLSFDAEIYLEGHATQPLSRAEMEADLKLLMDIGQAVERIGPDRAEVMAALPGVLGGPLIEDQVEIADSFLAGLSKLRS